MFKSINVTFHTGITESEITEFCLFVQYMVDKLNENRHKGGWESDDLMSLMLRLGDERSELHDRMLDVPIDGREVTREAADVANFAMMIAGNARRLEIEQQAAKEE